MCKKISYLLCICFMFVFGIVKADVVYEPGIIKINNILFYEDVAGKIFKDARIKHIDICDAKDKSIKVTTVTKNMALIIDGSGLMEEIAKLYNEVMAGDNTHVYRSSVNHVWVESANIMVYVDTEKRIVTSVLIHNDQYLYQDL